MENKKIINQPLSIIIGDCFGRYAKYIIQDRAIPDARDGLKPVQRRILYAMYELGLTNDKPYKKSARTVGEVIGKYHPHGDSSIYESMVRMSQSWKSNLPLLDMHGNNGSIDGDSPAAMRYTECRLSSVSNLMLENIKKNTVDFTFNFDDSEKEPVILPALLPNLLINGAVGIAAGYATNIPPHNPTEVFNAIIYLIDHPNATLDEIMKIIPAPDFPTGGIIEGKDGIKGSFETGKGKFILTSKFNINFDDKKYNQLIITEIPFDVTKSTIIKEINDIIFDEEISGIVEVRDESDKNGINIVIDIKKEKNIEQITNYLLKNTHLQISYSTNFVAIVNRKPVLLDLISALKHYINHALDIQRKTFIFDLEKHLNRLEIVDGLVIAINNIDEVISIIRKSDSKDDAKSNLISRFGFTENQAEAILVLRLYRLSKTDIGTLLAEAAELHNIIDNLKNLLSSQKLQEQYLINVLFEYRKLYGYSRKTKISENIKKLEINEEEMIDIKENIIFVSNDGYIKKITPKVYDSNELSSIGFKPLDFIFFSKKCFSNQYLLLVTKFGKAICLPIFKLENGKWKEMGQHINNFMTIDPSDKVVFANVIDSDNLENNSLLLFTKLGINKKILFNDFINLKSMKSTSIFKLKNDDEIISVNQIKNSNIYFVSLVSNVGNGYAFSSDEIPTLTKIASGVKSIKLKPNEFLVSANVSLTLDLLCLFVLNSGMRLSPLNEFKVLSRCSTGKSVLHIKTNTNDKLINVILVNKNSIITVLDENNQFISCDIVNFGINKFNKVPKVNNIINASYDYLNSGELFEDLKNAKILPKKFESNEDNDFQDQLSLLK